VSFDRRLRGGLSVRRRTEADVSTGEGNIDG
jgi:hypothetical protein